MDVTPKLVRALLDQPPPDLAALPFREVVRGWDNDIYRLGDELSVRLPRRLEGAALILHEQRWLPQLAVGLPLPVPVPVRVGIPGCGYPWAWSVCPWLPGVEFEAAHPVHWNDATRRVGRSWLPSTDPHRLTPQPTRMVASRWSIAWLTSRPASTSSPPRSIEWP